MPNYRGSASARAGSQRKVRCLRLGTGSTAGIRGRRDWAVTAWSSPQLQVVLRTVGNCPIFPFFELHAVPGDLRDDLWIEPEDIHIRPCRVSAARNSHEHRTAHDFWHFVCHHSLERLRLPCADYVGR